jgi:hypothetical protein
MTQQLFTSPIGLSQLDPPVSQRLALNLASNSGGSGGDDGAVVFVTGLETYVFDSNSIRGPQKPKAITAAWIDATNLAAGKSLVIQCSNGQKFILQNTTAAAGQGPQGYFIIPLPAPFKITVTTNNGAGVTVVIILYNYNVAFTGFQTGSYLPASATSSSAASGGSGGGTGGGGFSGGGGFRGCPITETDLAPVGNGIFENATFENENWIEVECEGGLGVIATPSHPVYSIERGKVSLHDLEVGEHVLTVHGEREVKSKLYYKDKGTAIKVHVPDSHLYYANGILSHNKQ